MKGLAIIWVAEKSDRRDVRGCVSGDLFHAQMDNLCALAAKNSFVSMLFMGSSKG